MPLPRHLLPTSLNSRNCIRGQANWNSFGGTTNWHFKQH